MNALTVNVINELNWLYANNKEDEFKAWCQKHDLQCDNFWSLHFFKAEFDKAAEKDKMTRSFIPFSGFFDGYCVAWEDGNGGTCRVWTLSKPNADDLFVTLAKDKGVTKYRVVNGIMRKLAEVKIC